MTNQEVDGEVAKPVFVPNDIFTPSVRPDSSSHRGASYVATDREAKKTKPIAKITAVRKRKANIPGTKHTTKQAD